MYVCVCVYIYIYTYIHTYNSDDDDDDDDDDAADYSSSYYYCYYMHIQVYKSSVLTEMSEFGVTNEDLEKLTTIVECSLLCYTGN